MRSDSVASYAGERVQFTGHVHYRDTTLTMDTEFGTYYRAAERWEGRGNVKTRNLKTGSTLVGPYLDYFRAVKGVRDTTEMYAVSRPRIEYFGKDSTADSTAAPGDSTRPAPRAVRDRGGPGAHQGRRADLGRAERSPWTGATSRHGATRSGSTPARPTTARCSASGPRCTGSGPTASISPGGGSTSGSRTGSWSVWSPRATPRP